MKAINAFLFVLIYCTSYGQDFYIEGIASAAIDSSFARASKLYDQSDYKTAALGFDSLEVEWKNIIESKPDEETYQNYYFIKAKQHRIERRLETLTAEDINVFRRLESSLKEKLTSSNIVIAYYYSALAESMRVVLSDLNASITYSNKSIDIYKQHGSPCLDQIASELLEMGIGYRQVLDYGKAESYYLKSLEVIKKIEPPVQKLLLNCQYRLSGVYLNQLKFDKGLQLALEVVKEAPKYFDKGHFVIYRSLDLVSIFYNQKGDSKKALEYAFAALRTLREGKEDGGSYMGDLFHAISYEYSKMGKYKLAQTYIDSSYNIVIRYDKYGDIARAYNMKALLAKDMNDELYYLNNAIEYCKKDTWCTQINLPIFLTDLGSYYERKGDRQTALNYYLKTKEIKEKHIDRSGCDLPDTYTLLASNYENLGMRDEADLYHNKAIETSHKYVGHDNRLIATQYSSYGYFLLGTKDYDKAEKYLNKASAILKNDSILDKLTFVNNNRLLSKLYEEKCEYDKSLKHALISYNSEMSFDYSSRIAVVKQLFSVHHKMGNIDACKKLLSELLDISGFTNDINSKPEEIALVQGNSWLSYNCFFSYLKLEAEINDEQTLLIEKVKYGILIIKKLRSEYFYESSEKELQKSVREFYNWSIENLGKQYRQTNDEKYLDLLYECIERSKSLIIDRQQIREVALSKTDIPQSVIDKEKDLIFAYEENYNDFKSQSQSSGSITNMNLQVLYKIQKQKETFIDSLKEHYPSYYESRYSQKFISLEACQDLATEEDRMFLVYHWGDSLIHKLEIDSEGTRYSEISIFDLESQVLRLKKLIKTPISKVSESNYKSEKQDFIQLSRIIFQQLIGEPYVLPKELTIVADNKLVNLPFGVLLSKDVELALDYRSLPYLLKSSAIQYCGSMSHYYTLKQHQGYDSNKDYIGFAPSYTSMTSRDTSLSTRENIIVPLQYNMPEVMESSALFDGEHYVAEAATESKFKAKAAQSNILHLAMHTQVGSNQAFDSYLQFEPRTSSQEDGRLYLDEIARLDLNNNLAVLSACETNVGEEIIGESILGIARAFQIASCPNIVLTNWLVDDKSSSSIIPYFFKRINEEEPPAIALQNAKLHYLQNCSQVQSHPYFWAGYSYYGSAEIEQVEDDFWNSSLLIGFLGFSFICYFLFSFNKKLS